MKIADALQAGKNKYQQARELECKKRKLRPLTVTNFHQEFISAFERVYGTRPLEITKDTYKKLSGLIKMLKKNGIKTGQDAYEFIEWLFDSWPSFKEVYTLNRKKYTLAVKPNILDIINCRDYFLEEYRSEGQELEYQDNDDDLLNIWENQ